MKLDKQKFDVNKLAAEHETDQSGLVRNKEKAYDMAREEDIPRGFVDQYKAYSLNPSRFISEHPEVKPHTITSFKALYDQGVPPEYILRHIELSAEVGGDVYDFRKKIKKYSPDQLLELRDTLERSVQIGTSIDQAITTPARSIWDRKPEDVNRGFRFSRDLEQYWEILAELQERGLDEDDSAD